MNSKEIQLYPGFQDLQSFLRVGKWRQGLPQATSCSSTVHAHQVLLSLQTGLTSLGAQQGQSAETVLTKMGEKKAEASHGLKDRSDKQS